MTSTDQYDAVIARIQRTVAALNADLGLSTEFDEHFRRTCVAFGYIGNCAPTAPTPTTTASGRSTCRTPAASAPPTTASATSGPATSTAPRPPWSPWPPSAAA
jgi:hypothetical protein